MIPEGTVVKPGDELIRDVGKYGDKQIVTVKSVSRSGRITVKDKYENDEKYDPDGVGIGRRGVPRYLSLPTPEIRKQIVRQTNLDILISACQNKEHPITDDQLERIVAILNEKERN